MLINLALKESVLVLLLQVIEAVFERMDLKKKIFGELDRVCKPDAILASNTSTLDIDQVGKQAHLLFFNFLPYFQYFSDIFCWLIAFFYF